MVSIPVPSVLARRTEDVHGTEPFPQLRDQILTAISTFVGPAEQQDDMTMLLLRVEAMEAAAA